MEEKTIVITIKLEDGKVVSQNKNITIVNDKPKPVGKAGFKIEST